MVCGTLPFDGDNLSAMLQAILSSTPVLPNSVSPELRGLLGRLLMKDSKTRITVRQIMEHPWLADTGTVNTAALARMKVQEAEELDDEVLSEMRVLGYEIGSLLQDLKNYVFDERTAAYRMLRRRKILDEIHALATHPPRPRPPEPPAEATASERLPALETECARPPRRSDQTSASPGLPRLGVGPRVRTRTNQARPDPPVPTPLPTVPLG
jgi:serine/threonine protein kinase